MSRLSDEAARRRTFAIISHPDAGKTTLTEKLLLYGGAINLAGSVRARKSGRHALSDWMEMEKTRGISITSSVLQFEYQGRALNLLDTPGHADFSEDTYRTLSAVDSAVMLIDHSKGVEGRTLRLFEVCRLRRLPVITFMNKLDRDGLEPLELLDDVMNQLGGLRCCPMNWPIGMGRGFQGVVDLRTQVVTLFEGGKHGSEIAQTRTCSLEEAAEFVDHIAMATLHEELELLEGAGDPWDVDEFVAGDLTPVFWGSALTNFGLDPFVDFVVNTAPPPTARTTEGGMQVDPEDERFSGFVFKIQANMNPRHRDRIAFMRVVSGRFERGMDVVVGRSGEKLRLSKPHTFMAQERSIVDEAWPGDIVGLFDPGNLRLADTLSGGEVLRFGGIPRFAPEHFAKVRIEDPMRRKQLKSGLQQLSYEGAIQLFSRPDVGLQDPWLGAVGMLQFEVLKERLKNEYSVEVHLQILPYQHARWVEGDEETLAWLARRSAEPLLEDRHGNPVVVAASLWPLQTAQQRFPTLVLHDVEPL